MRRNRMIQGQQELPRRVQTGDWVYIRRPAQNTIDVSVSDEKWQVQELRPSGVVKLRAVTGEERVIHQSQCMGAAGQQPRRDMTAEAEHGGMSSSAGGTEHVSKKKGTETLEEPTWHTLRNRDVTAVYQRRNRSAAGTEREHATSGYLICPPGAL